jgi:hypothetical protein
MEERTQTPDRHTRRNETGLDISTDVFSDEVIQGLIEDWIVPMFVNEIIEKILRQSR